VPPSTLRQSSLPITGPSLFVPGIKQGPGFTPLTTFCIAPDL